MHVYAMRGRRDSLQQQPIIRVANTARLELRQFHHTDAQGLYSMNSDPEVMRFTGDPPFPSVSSARQFLAAYDHYQQHGFGRWSVYRKTDAAYLGFCGLRFCTETGEVDVGYRLLKQEWGKGYATEAAEASLKLGFEAFGLHQIIGRAQVANTASVMVLKKLGMARHVAFSEEGRDWEQYRIRCEDFKKRQ